MAKRGQPPKESSSSNKIRQEVYLEVRHQEYLNEIAETTTTTKAAVIRFALDQLIEKYPNKKRSITELVDLIRENENKS